LSREKIVDAEFAENIKNQSFESGRKVNEKIKNMEKKKTKDVGSARVSRGAAGSNR
jgi:hypothetical protein